MRYRLSIAVGNRVTPVPRLWCAIRVVGAERSLDALSGDALRYRHTEPGHLVEHRAADPGFGRLGRQCPGAQTATDDSFVAEHGGLPKRAPAVADRLLPAQAPLVPDHPDGSSALSVQMGCRWSLSYWQTIITRHEERGCAAGRIWRGRTLVASAVSAV